MQTNMQTSCAWVSSAIATSQNTVFFLKTEYRICLFEFFRACFEIMPRLFKIYANCPEPMHHVSVSNRCVEFDPIWRLQVRLRLTDRTCWCWCSVWRVAFLGWMAILVALMLVENFGILSKFKIYELQLCAYPVLVLVARACSLYVDLDISYSQSSLLDLDLTRRVV